MSGTITPPQTALIPLEILPNPGLQPSSGPPDWIGFKVGIPVSLDGGTTYKLYEFDTGGGGFEAAYNPAWWAPNSPVNNGDTFTTTYKSGIIDNSVMVSVPVTFQTMPGSAPIPTADYDVAQIISVGDTNAASTFPATWNADVNAGTPAPLYGNFWGDFGASLENTNSTLLPAGTGFLAILPQLPGNLSKGFIIGLGPEPGIGQSSQGYLQVGLTQADINSFPIQIKMPGSTGVYPNSQQPIYTGELSTGTITVTDPNNISNSYTASTGLVWDTGTPTLEMYPGATVPYAGLQPFLTDPGSATGGTLASGNIFDLTSTVLPAGVQSILNFDIGTNIGSTAANVGNPLFTLGNGSVNTGLQPFFADDVMFDVADGIIGLRPHQAAPCFAGGTRIATLHGPAPVEHLCIGDEVVALLGAPIARIEWIGHRRVNCRHHPDPTLVWPIRISADAFDAGRPCQDLWLSPDHAVYAYGVLIPVKYLINGSSIVQVPVDEITYWHVELRNHDVLLAEALPVESYLDVDGRRNFTNGDGPTQLFPDFSSRAWEAHGCAPLRVIGTEIQAVRHLLEQRAAMKACVRYEAASGADGARFATGAH